MQGRRQIRVLDREGGGQCVLEGRGAKNKFLNFSDPWFSETGREFYFKAEVNDAYRRSLGLKPLRTPARIGEASWDCKKVALRPVSQFLAEHPMAALPDRLSSSVLPDGPE